MKIINMLIFNENIISSSPNTKQMLNTAENCDKGSVLKHEVKKHTFRQKRREKQQERKDDVWVELKVQRDTLFNVGTKMPKNILKKALISLRTAILVFHTSNKTTLLMLHVLSFQQKEVTQHFDLLNA